MTKNETDSYIPIFLVCFFFFFFFFLLLFFFLTVHKCLCCINTGPVDLIHGPWEKLETSEKQNNALRSSNTPNYIIVLQAPLHQPLSTTVSTIVPVEAKF